MNLLIVAAVETELGLLKAETRAVREGGSRGNDIYSGRIGRSVIYLGLVGIGPVSGAFHLGTLLGSVHADMIIMTGSAGALPGSGLDIGDVAVASSEVFAEMGLCIGPGMADASRLGLPELEQEIRMDHRVAEGLMEAARETARPQKGRFLTVAGVSADLFQAEARTNQFDAIAENMEGFALAFAGLRSGIPTGSVRGISNMAGERDKSAWRPDSANEKAQATVLNYLRRLV